MADYPCSGDGVEAILGKIKYEPRPFDQDERAASDRRGLRCISKNQPHEGCHLRDDNHLRDHSSLTLEAGPRGGGVQGYSALKTSPVRRSPFILVKRARFILYFSKIASTPSPLQG